MEKKYNTTEEKKEAHNRDAMKYYNNNKEKCNVACLKSRRNSPKQKETQRKYQIKNRDKINKRNNERRKDNPEVRDKLNLNKRLYRIKNKERLLQMEKDRLNEDIRYYLRIRIKSRLSDCLKKYSNGNKPLKISECNIDWEGIFDKLEREAPLIRTGWSIDHIKPFCSFDLSRKEQVEEVMAVENHRWMLNSENKSKGNQDRILSIYPNRFNTNNGV